MKIIKTANYKKIVARTNSSINIDKYVSSAMGLIFKGMSVLEAVEKVTQKRPEIADEVLKQIKNNQLSIMASVEKK